MMTIKLFMIFTNIIVMGVLSHNSMNFVFINQFITGNNELVLENHALKSTYAINQINQL